MKLLLTLVLLTLLQPCKLARAEDEKLPVTERPLLMSSLSFGFSYPLIFSGGLGLMLPLGVQENNYIYPSVVSLRLDGDIGLGGGAAGAGVYIPAGGSFAINLKAVRLRTWLLAWNESPGQVFDGSVVELVMLSHVPGKIGLGFFSEAEPHGNARDTFTYVFAGVGW